MSCAVLISFGRPPAHGRRSDAPVHSDILSWPPARRLPTSSAKLPMAPAPPTPPPSCRQGLLALPPALLHHSARQRHLSMWDTSRCCFFLVSTFKEGSFSGRVHTPALPVQELRTVASEIEALDRQAKAGGDEVRWGGRAQVRRMAAPQKQDCFIRAIYKHAVHACLLVSLPSSLPACSPCSLPAPLPACPPLN